MNLKSLLLSSDDKTIRTLRRVLSDLEIEVEHFSRSENAVRKITRERFEAIIVDCNDPSEATRILQAVKAAPVNKRALSIVLVEAHVGLRGGFDTGAHFVLHKPISIERAKASFRAVRALMKRERRRQLRVPVQIPVRCIGAHSYQAKTLDLCEGGMALQFKDRIANEKSLMFLLELPGYKHNLELHGELAWESHGRQAGVRFHDVNEEQRDILRKWLNSQLPEPERDDPPVNCLLAELSPGGCYLKTSTPFPAGTRVLLASTDASLNLRASAIVRVAHPEFGMGVEFLQSTSAEQDQVRLVIQTLHSSGRKTTELLVEPDGLDTGPAVAGIDDPLVNIFRRNEQVPIETFLQQMQER